jgi:hypothetical protein
MKRIAYMVLPLLALPALATVDSRRVVETPAETEVPACGTGDSCSTLARAYAVPATAFLLVAYRGHRGSRWPGLRERHYRRIRWL